MRAAFFELRADYYGRPFDDGIIHALLDAGFEVDLFAPDGELPQPIYPPSVRRLPIEYRRRWLQRHLNPAPWRRYDLFLGTSDLPMAFAGVVSGLARRPVVTAADEIFVGGYEGFASPFWERLAKRGMHNALFTIITDVCRIPLQREYASLPPDHEFASYPCCYALPYRGRSREEARRALGIGADDFVLSFTGTFTANNGAQWVVRLLDSMPDVRLLVQPGGHTDPVTDALLARDPRILHLPARLSWKESMEVTVAADAALVFYLSPKPQFQLMGVSSQKLCTALWLGMPVIATRQESFRFLEEYGCGELIDGEEQLASAVERVRASRGSYAPNTRRAIADYIRPADKMADLSRRFRAL